MKILKNVFELNKAVKNYKNVGFVPTMGGIHKGHVSLIKISQKNNKETIVSIFVNPTQFNQKKDFKNYPRNIRKDILILKKLKVIYLFLPEVNEIYKNKMKKAYKAKDNEAGAKYHLLQYTMKILLNSLYGATALPSFRYGNVNLSKAITLSGQRIIQESALVANREMNKEIKMTAEMLNLLGCSKENFKKLLKSMNYKIINKENETFFKYIPKKNFKKQSKKIQKENPFGILKNLNFN